MNEEFYISAAGEIFDGYTEFDFYGRTLYLKHLSIKDQRNLHLYYEKYKKKAIDRGVETEESILKKVKEDGLWNEDDDIKISSLELEIENLKKTKESIFLPSQKEEFQKTITKKESELGSLLGKRREIVGKTAEDYAANMAAVEMIRYFVFDTKDLNNNAFSQDVFDEMSDFEVLKLKSIQNEVSDRLSEKTIQKVSLRPFFNLYLSFCENASAFYGAPLVDLSVHQLKLVVWGRVFHSIFQYVEDIPQDVREDPDRLLAFSEAKSNKGKNNNFIKDDAAASTVFGGTAQDVKDLAGGDQVGVSLSDEIKKAGGKLSMEQMMRLAGQ